MTDDPPIVTHDFETRSACSLLKHGSWLYSKHPTTQPMCLTYNLPWEGDHIRLWHMAHPNLLITESPPPEPLFEAIRMGCLFEAHNAFFEWAIWLNVMVKRWGWPEIPGDMYRCSAAKASASSLPRALEDAALAVCLPIQKDMDGNRRMKRISKPKKPNKAERAEFKAQGLDPAEVLLWHEDEADIVGNWNYCGQDVLTEKAFSAAVDDLMPNELAMWKMDQTLNRRGIRVDLEMATAALKMADDWKALLNSELHDMTGVERGSMRQQVKDWLADYAQIALPDTAAPTLEWFLEHENVEGVGRRVLEIMRSVNRTSTRKYQAMIDKADPDDWRVRDIMMYCGAGRTGRWSAKGIQVHNFPARDLVIKSDEFEQAVADIKSGDMAWCRALYGDIMEFLSHALRGAIIPEEGRDFIVADYSAIEARCVLWLADALEALMVFRRGEDIYCDMATGIYGQKITKANKTERQFGKQAVLGLGYGMGFVTFLLTCRKYKIYFSVKQVLDILGQAKFEKYCSWVHNSLLLDDKEWTKAEKGKRRQAAMWRGMLTDQREQPRNIVHELALMKYTVDVYRKKYSEVKSMWTDQEASAIEAVQNPTKRVPCGKVTWFMDGPTLKCELPSGRCLNYRDAHIKATKTSWGEVKPALRYMGVSDQNKWVRIATYGGKIVENITQAVARDIMAEAMLRAHEGDTYDTVMSVHDELVCEVDKNEGSIKEFEALMSAELEWADGCPITAEADRYERYRK